MKKYNISTHLIQVIKILYNRATSAVLFSGSIGDWFWTTVGVQQGCLLSPSVFNIFPERIMTDALEDHEGTVSFGGRTITNLRFADDIDGLAGEEEELANLVEHLDKASTAYGMEISAKKTKLRQTTPVASTQRSKWMDRSLRQSEVSNYLGSVVTDEGSKPEILCRIAQATAALTRLKPVWIDKSISLSSKMWLMRSLVIFIFQYACESWTLTAELQRRIETMEMRCYHKILHISYKDQFTNKEVRAKIQQAIGPHEDLLTIAKRCKLQWYGHVSCSSGLAKTILQGTVKGGRRQGRQRKRWGDNIREWTGLEFSKSQMAVENREEWRKLVAKSSVVPQRPSRLRDWWWW